jgi:hypothetical protein
MPTRQGAAGLAFARANLPYCPHEGAEVDQVLGS